MSGNANTFILLFQSADQKGIGAKISDFILKHGGNIITADQHTTDPKNGDFFMRVEFIIEGPSADKSVLSDDFFPVGRKFGAQWKIHCKQDNLRMGILVSQADHCLFDLLYLWRSGQLKVDLSFVISNYEKHRKIADQFEVPFYFIPAQRNDRHENEIMALVKKKTDFLVLARYMLVLSEDFLKEYFQDIINIHHGLLPSFKGANPYRQALDKGVKVIGATAHFVNERLDTGPIIAQATEEVTHKDDLASLMLKGMNLEKKALAEAILNYIDYRVVRYKNKTVVFE